MPPFTIGGRLVTPAKTIIRYREDDTRPDGSVVHRGHAWAPVEARNGTPEGRPYRRGAPRPAWALRALAQAAAEHPEPPAAPRRWRKPRA